MCSDTCSRSKRRVFFFSLKAIVYLSFIKLHRNITLCLKAVSGIQVIIFIFLLNILFAMVQNRTSTSAIRKNASKNGSINVISLRIITYNLLISYVVTNMFRTDKTTFLDGRKQSPSTLFIIKKQVFRIKYALPLLIKLRLLVICNICLWL